MNLAIEGNQKAAAGTIIFNDDGVPGLIQAAAEGDIPNDLAKEASQTLNQLSRRRKIENIVLAPLLLRLLCWL